MKRKGATLVFDNLLDWGPPSAFTADKEEAKQGKWLVSRGIYGSSSGVLASTEASRPAPELGFDPRLKGWHEVRVRVHHTSNRNEYGVYVGTTRDRALRVLRPELGTEEFETLSLGPREMTGARVRLDASYAACSLDSVEFVPCEAPRPLPPAEKELCAILDFADAPDDYRPLEHCAAECVRVHAEAGFTTIFWKSLAVRCEYHTKVGELRSARLQPDMRVSVGTLLDRYDTLDAAVAEARACHLKILGWMRINNETSATTGEWSKFSATTPFHLAHPEMRKRTRTGELTPKLSFAYPEVRQYMCAIGREILDRGMDGLVIDVLRHPPMVMYDKPLVDAFVQKTGRNPMEMEGDGDEEWLRFRATAFTDLLRDFRRMMDASGHRGKALVVRTMPQLWRNLRDGCDVEAWMREQIPDTVVVGHHCIISPGHPLHYDLKPIRDVVAGRARFIVQVLRFAEMPTALELSRQAFAHGADGTAIYESNLVVTLPSQRDALKRLRSAAL